MYSVSQKRIGDRLAIADPLLQVCCQDPLSFHKSTLLSIYLLAYLPKLFR
jgi:hypothetical protein